MRVLALALAALTLTSCSAPVDLKRSLEVTDVLGGFYDAGVVEGRNKIVPSITFTVRKDASASVTPLQLNIVFRQKPLPGTQVAAGTTGETDWEDVFLQNVKFNDNRSEPLTVRPKVGYTGDPPQ